MYLLKKKEGNVMSVSQQSRSSQQPLSQQPLSQQPPTKLQKVRTFLKKHKWKITIFVIVVILSLVVWIFINKKKKKKDIVITARRSDPSSYETKAEGGWDIEYGPTHVPEFILGKWSSSNGKFKVIFEATRTLFGKGVMTTSSSTLSPEGNYIVVKEYSPRDGEKECQEILEYVKKSTLTPYLQCMDSENSAYQNCDVDWTSIANTTDALTKDIRICKSDDDCTVVKLGSVILKYYRCKVEKRMEDFKWYKQEYKKVSDCTLAELKHGLWILNRETNSSLSLEGTSEELRSRINTLIEKNQHVLFNECRFEKNEEDKIIRWYKLVSKKISECSLKELREGLFMLNKEYNYNYGLDGTETDLRSSITSLLKKADKNTDTIIVKETYDMCGSAYEKSKWKEDWSEEDILSVSNCKGSEKGSVYNCTVDWGALNTEDQKELSEDSHGGSNTYSIEVIENGKSHKRSFIASSLDVQRWYKQKECVFQFDKQSNNIKSWNNSDCKNADDKLSLESILESASCYKDLGNNMVECSVDRVTHEKRVIIMLGRLDHDDDYWNTPNVKMEFWRSKKNGKLVMSLPKLLPGKELFKR